MSPNEALIAWTPVSHNDNPTAGQVRVGHLVGADEGDWTDRYAYTGGAAYTDRRALRGDASLKMLFIDFQKLVVTYGMDPQVVHNAFLSIDGYAASISPDILGSH